MGDSSLLVCHKTRSGLAGEDAAAAAPVEEPTALYRVYGDADRLLYIGISKDFGIRWNQHARVQPWWGDKKRLTVDWCDSRDAAEAAERAAIKAEKPKYNIVHNGPAVAEAEVRGVTDPMPFFWRRLSVGDMRRMTPVAVMGGFRPADWLTVPEAGTPEAVGWGSRLREALLRGYGSGITRISELIEATRWGEQARPDSETVAVLARNLRGSMYRLVEVACPECNGSPPGRMTCMECGATGEGTGATRSLGSELTRRGVLGYRVAASAKGAAA